MAKHNHVRITGEIAQVLEVPTDDHGKRLFVKLNVARDKGEKMDHPIVLVDNKEYFDKLIEAEKQKKFVSVRGLIETHGVNIYINCENCQTPFNRSISKMIVKAKKLDIFKPDAPIYDNTVHLLGSLATDVTCQEAVTKVPRSTYKLAVNLHQNVAHYPWIVSFYDQAVSDKERMQMKSQCLVYGFLQTRKINIGCVCPACFHKHVREITTGEVLAVSVEYLNNCNFTDKELLREEELLKQAIEQSNKEKPFTRNPNRIEAVNQLISLKRG